MFILFTNADGELIAALIEDDNRRDAPVENEDVVESFFGLTLSDARLSPELSEAYEDARADTLYALRGRPRFR